MKKFISTVLALGMAASLAACGGSASTAASTESTAASAAEATADSDLAYIKNKGKMTIGYTVYEPMNYTDADGNFTGFDTELATAVCAKLGVEPDFVEINWDTKIVELDAKSIDCIWNGMTLTDDIMANTACATPLRVSICPHWPRMHPALSRQSPARPGGLSSSVPFWSLPIVC